MALQTTKRHAARALSRAMSTFTAGPDEVTLPDLPYEYSALEPYISAEIMELHHSKHHATYVKNYNAALQQWKEAEAKQDSASAPKIASALHFNGGGHLNHSIFWKNLCPAKDVRPLEDADALKKAIERDFGGVEEMKAKFNAANAGIQGSGWGWLAAKPVTGKLQIITAPNQDPLSFVAPGMVPLLGIDMWEHAFYLQYKNVKPDYLNAIWHVVNWADVSARYSTVLEKEV